MGEDMVERVARALCRVDSHPENATMDGKPLWMDYIPEARAAIEAMREPTGAMAKAGAGAELTTSYGGEYNTFDYLSGENAADVWRDMIDAALNQKGVEG